MLLTLSRLKGPFTLEIYYAIAITIRFKNALCTHFCICDRDSYSPNRKKNGNCIFNRNRVINHGCEWTLNCQHLKSSNIFAIFSITVASQYWVISHLFSDRYRDLPWNRHSNELHFTIPNRVWHLPSHSDTKTCTPKEQYLPSWTIQVSHPITIWSGDLLSILLRKSSVKIRRLVLSMLQWIYLTWCEFI